MASSWNGSWGGSFGGSWGEVDANAMSGAATFGLSASGVLIGVVVEPTTLGGLFRPIRDAVAHAVSGRVKTSWALLNPIPVVKIVVSAETSFVSGSFITARGCVLAPMTGLRAPAVSRRGVFTTSTALCHAGARSVAVSGRAYPGFVVSSALCGAKTTKISRNTQAGGYYCYPRTVQNPTYQQLMAVF